MIRSLQSLRGGAFLLIFISHCTFFSSRFGYWGSFGVSIFIMLSGFLTARNMYEKNQKKYQNETKWINVKRVLTKIKKVYPLHIITTLFMLVIILMTQKSEDYLTEKIITNVLLIKGFVPCEKIYFSLNSVSWYLSIFLLFTLLELPLFRLSDFVSSKQGTVIPFFAVMIIVEIVWTIFCTRYSWEHWGVYINPFFRLIEFLMGSIIGCFISKKGRDFYLNNWIKIFICGMCLIPLVLAVLIEPNSSIWFLNFIWIFPSMGLIFFFYSIKDSNSYISKMFNNGVFSYFGNIGLEVFLLHKIIIYLWSYFVNNSSILLFRIIGLAMCLAITTALAQLFKNFSNRLNCRKANKKYETS